MTSPNLIQNINSASNSAKVKKVLPPPPKAFRDPPKTIQESEDMVTNHTSSTETTTKRPIELTEKNPMANTEPSSGNSVPMRRKLKEQSYKMDHSTSSLSR